jgi:hypothetical protein
MSIEFVTSPYFTAFLAFIAIFSLMFNYYTYRKTLSYQRLYYQIKGRKIFDKDELRYFDDVNIEVDNKNLRSLYSFSILLYNAGSKSIDFADIVNSEGIQILSSEKPELFSAIIGENETPEAQFSLKHIEDHESDLCQLVISFKFIPPKSGITIECLSSISNNSFYINSVTKDFGYMKRGVPYSRVSELVLLFCIISTLVIILFSISVFGKFISSSIGGGLSALIVVIMGVAALFVMPLAYRVHDIWSRRYLHPAIRRFTG